MDEIYAFRKQEIEKKYREILEKMDGAFLYSEPVSISSIPELVVAAFYDGMMEGMGDTA